MLISFREAPFICVACKYSQIAHDDDQVDGSRYGQPADHPNSKTAWGHASERLTS
jgi:hypothetical protein